MAVQNKPYVRMSGGGVLLFEVFMEYEDTDFLVTNDDGDPDDFRLIRFYGTNHSSLPISIDIKKGNGSSWQTATLPAGESFSQDAGGSVKYESDVPEWVYS